MNTDCLFLLHDAGETYAALPVIEALQVAGISCMLFPEAAALNILRQKASSFSVTSTPENVSCKVLLSGVVSRRQFAICQRQKASGAAILPYYDNLLIPPSQNPLKQRIFPFKKLAGRLLVARDMEKDCIVVGNPSLELWQTPCKKLSQTIAYIGGYGPGYKEAFGQFLAIFSGAGLDQYLQVLVHPKFFHQEQDTLLEHHILLDYGFKPVNHIVRHTPTIEAAKAARLIVTHTSSVGVQALIAGKRVAFCGPDLPSMVHLGLAHPLRTRQDFNRFLENDSLDKNIFELLRIPPDGKALMMQEITRHLSPALAD